MSKTFSKGRYQIKRYITFDIKSVSCWNQGGETYSLVAVDSKLQKGKKSTPDVVSSKV